MEGKESQELQQLLERGQPQLSDEARELGARLNAWVSPVENLPIDSDYIRFPEQFHPSIQVPEGWKREEARAYLDRCIRAPGTDNSPLSPEVMRALEQHCADIEKFWESAHPGTYSLLKKYNLMLKPRGRLVLEVLKEEGRINRDLASLVGLNTIFNKHALYVDINLSPVEIIRQALNALHLLENVDHHFAAGMKDYDLRMKWVPHAPYQRIIDVIELNHNLAEYAVPVRYTPMEKLYREAYNQAIRTTYECGRINGCTSDEELRTLGQRAGRIAVAELREPGRPGKQLFPLLQPAYWYTELQGTEALGIAPLKIGELAFRTAIERWAQEVPIGSRQVQRWIWTHAEDNELEALPRQFRLKGRIYFTSHTIVAQGKLVTSGGELRLVIIRTQEGVHIEATRLTNHTGHYQVDAASLYAHVEPVTKALQRVGITTEGMEVTTWWDDILQKKG